MRPVSVFANGPGSEIEKLQAGLRGQWRPGRPDGDGAAVAARVTAVPDRGAAGLPSGYRAPLDQAVQQRRAGGAGRPAPVRAAPARRTPAGRADHRATGPAGPVDPCPRIRRYLGWPQVSMRTLCRRVRLVAISRRPRLTARGDPDHDHVVAQIVARLIDLPHRAVVLAEDETYLNLLPHVRASWTLRTARPQIPTPGTNWQVIVFGALEGDHRALRVPAGPPLRRGLHRPAGPGAAGIPAGPGDRRDLR